jgi:drug/metabolite transporter (DMT)-like permease
MLRKCSPSPVTRRPHPVLLGTLVSLMILAWSINLVVGKIGLRHMDVISLATFRIIAAGLLMGLLYLFKQERRRFGLKDFWIFSKIGFFGVVMNMGLFTLGLKYTTAGHSAMIIALAPIIVLLLAWFMRLEALTALKTTGLSLSFIGVMILATEQGIHLHSGTLLGDLITLGCAIGFAIYTVLGKQVAANYDSFTMNTFNLLASSIMLSPLAIHQAIHLDWRAVGWVGWISVLYMAGIGSVAAYLIYYWALRQMAASRIAAVGYAQPVLGILFGVVFLGEHLTRPLLLGGLLVLFGLYLTERKSEVAELGEEEDS